MRVHDYGKLPEGLQYHSSYDIAEFSGYDVKALEDLGLDEIWYWYGVGSYEGDGQVLMRRGDQYDVHSCSHCSCYGPLENVSFDGEPIAELATRHTEDAWLHVAPLFELAGYVK